MNTKKKIFGFALALALIVSAHFAFDVHSASATTCLGAGSGGTGICNATSSNVGQAIVVSSTVTSGGITVPVYTYKTISGGGGSSSTYTTVGGTGVTSTVAVGATNTTTTVTLNINNGSVQTCVAGQDSNGISAVGIISCNIAVHTIAGVNTSTISFVAAGGTSITTSTNSITFTTVSTSTANTWTALQSYTQGITVNGTTTLASTTNAILVTNASGQVSGFAGSNCSGGQAPTGHSATGTVQNCTTYLQSNQSVTLTISGDATGTASGATSINDSITVSGLLGKALPSLATGTLEFTGGAWTLGALPLTSYNVIGGTGISTATTTNSATITNTGVISFNGGTGAAVYTVNAGTGLSVTTSTTSSTLTLNINGGSVQNCTNQAVTGISSSGVITCSAVVSSIGGVATGTVQIIAGTNITISTTTNSITINSTASGTVSSATSSPGTFTITGNGTSTISGNATTTSVINNLNNIQYVPQNYATAGCAGIAGPMNWQTCVYDIYKSMAPVGGGQIWQDFDIGNSTSTGWTSLLSFNINGDQVSLNCTTNAVVPYVGTSTPTADTWLPSGQNIALNFDFGNPIGHARTSESGNCDMRGSSSLVAAGNAMTATSTGIYFGGTYSYTDNTLTATTSNAGAVGVDVDYNINGFGRNLWYGANAYVDEFTGSSSGGNCSAMSGCLLFFDVANNSGERWVMQGGTYTDPGNSTTTNAVFLSNAGTASIFFNFNSVDDAPVICGSSDGQCDVSSNHVENAAYNTYGAYIPFQNPSSDRSTMLIVSSEEFANDATTGSGKTWVTLIKHGGQLIAQGDHIDNYGGATITNFSDHSNDNGIESELICQIQITTGGLTNIVAGGGGNTYSQATGANCTEDVGNSFAIEMFANSNNVNDITSGNNLVATFDHTGNWTLGLAGTSGSLNLQGNFNATGTITSSGNTTVKGTLILPNVTSTFLATDANGNVIATGTPSGGGGGGSGNLFVTPSSSILANNVVAFQTNASTTVKATSSIYTYADGGVSINTSTEAGAFNIANASGTNVLKVSSITNPTSSAVLLDIQATSSVFQVLASGHINATGTAPTMGTCGSSPTVIGNDFAGTITIGSGVVTSCAMNFAIPMESSNYQCVATDNSAAISTAATSQNVSTVTFGLSATLGSGKIFYMCTENL